MAAGAQIIDSASFMDRIELALLQRNLEFQNFFSKEADRLARACEEMAERFLAGGRLLAFGHGACSTDAQHVSVEFVHPVIVGKRALPALDLSAAFRPWLEVMVREQDIVMGFGPPPGNACVDEALRGAELRGAMTFALPGSRGSYSFRAPGLHPFIHQEMVELLYHTLWETVHVFLEHETVGHSAGESDFLYPFLGDETKHSEPLLKEVAASIVTKAQEDARLRAEVGRTQVEALGAAALAIRARLERGGKLIVFGNGGSATDANDFALDCFSPPEGYSRIPAISLSFEPANITALANDVGTELIYLRQLIAHAEPQDIAIGISTSGGSKNIVTALEEARRRGLLTVALLGYDGGEIARRGLANHALVVRSDYIPRIQEVQASMYHILRDLIEPDSI